MIIGRDFHPLLPPGIPANHSNPAENQKNDNDEEDQPQSSGRIITPVSAVRPSG
jgi:hypothetical protein